LLHVLFFPFIIDIDIVLLPLECSLRTSSIQAKVFFLVSLESKIVKDVLFMFGDFIQEQTVLSLFFSSFCY